MCVWQMHCFISDPIIKSKITYLIKLNVLELKKKYILVKLPYHLVRLCRHDCNVAFTVRHAMLIGHLVFQACNIWSTMCIWHRYASEYQQQMFLLLITIWIMVRYIAGQSNFYVILWWCFPALWQLYIKLYWTCL